MRIPCHTFLLKRLAVLSLAVWPLFSECSSAVAKPISMQGKWKLISNKMDGRESPAIDGIEEIGGVWDLKSDGTADCNGTKAKWKYDSENQKIVIQMLNPLGSAFRYFTFVDGDVQQSGENVIIKFKVAVIRPCVMILTPVATANNVPESEKPKPSVTLDVKLKKKVVKESPPIRLARGTEKVIEDNYKILHSVTMSKGWNAGADVKGKATVLWQELEIGIRAGIEKSESKSYGAEEWLKRSVTIKGDGSKAMVKVVWVEYIRTGTAKVVIDGKEVEVPFEFREDFDLLTEDASEEGKD